MEIKNHFRKRKFEVNPINLYSLSKLSNEQFAQSISKTINTTMIGLRFFTIYGPWGRPDMMILKYLISAYKKLSFPLFLTMVITIEILHISMTQLIFASLY